MSDCGLSDTNNNDIDKEYSTISEIFDPNPEKRSVRFSCENEVIYEEYMEDFIVDDDIPYGNIFFIVLEII